MMNRLLELVCSTAVFEVLVRHGKGTDAERLPEGIVERLEERQNGPELG